MGLQLQIGPDMIEQVMKEWEAEKHGREMTPAEFSERMTAKMFDTAKPSDATDQ
jgi:hypothetical protein